MTTLQSRATLASPGNDPRGAAENASVDGTLVSTLLAGLGLTDDQKVAQSGIVVTGATGNGSWQYSTHPAVWTDFGAVSNDSTLLLDSSSRVRYVPGGRNREIARLTYRAWEQQPAGPALRAGGTPSPTRSASANLTVVTTAEPAAGNGKGVSPGYGASEGGRSSRANPPRDHLSSGSISSIGKGNTIVELLSPAIWVSVCR